MFKDKSVDNTLEFFKESSDHQYFLGEKGGDKIFLHHLCAEAQVPRKYYSMATINAAFERNQNKESFLGKVTSMFYALQQGMKNGFQDSQYEHAETDYPQLYKAVVSKISIKALSAMEKREQDYGLSVYPKNLGKIVAKQIRVDKKDLSDNRISNKFVSQDPKSGNSKLF